MKERFSIFAAPRTKGGVYRFCDSKPLYRRDFESLDDMLRFWRSNILPNTSMRTGKEFELAMIIERDSKWNYHDKPRYSTVPILAEDDLV